MTSSLRKENNDETVEQALLNMPTILIAPLALIWLVNHPDYQLPKQGHVVLYGTNDRVSTEALTGKRNTGLDVEMTGLDIAEKSWTRTQQVGFLGLRQNQRLLN